MEFTSKTMIVRSRYASFIAFLFVISLLSGCVTPVKLISDYDEQTDKAITELQRKFETFFVKLEGDLGTPAASFDNSKKFYDEIRIDVSAIKLRVNALPHNEITSNQIDILLENVALLMEVHEEGISTVELIQIPRQDFNTALSNILKLELAKRRGE